MSISEFRKKKLMYVFNTFFDFDKSGSIDKKDFQIAINRINRNRGWDPENPKAQSIRETLLKMWDDLRMGADADQDGQISREEWLLLWKDYGKDPSSPTSWQEIYMNIAFQLFDVSGNGSIDQTEFCNACSYDKVPEDEAKEAFKKLNVGTEITQQTFTELWKEYFSSDDPAAPGNYIFGKTSF